MERRCPNCGKEANEGQVLCGNCGAALPPSPSPSPVPPYDLDIPPPPPLPSGREQALGIVIGFFTPWVLSAIGGALTTLLGPKASLTATVAVMASVYIVGALVIWLSTRKRYPRFAKAFGITVLIVYVVVGAIGLGALLLCVQALKGL